VNYALITPAKNEEANLPRLAESIAAQTVLPEGWLIVDDGSTDGSVAIARDLASRFAWVSLRELSRDSIIDRGGPIVRAFQDGLRTIDPLPDVVVKLDADLSFDADYFERLLAAFAAEPELGIASGSAYELEAGVWTERHQTGDSVWGAARAYRRECLLHVLPLPERIGWDGIDALKAAVGGWRTRTLRDLPFRHHRSEGERDGRWRAWEALGRCAHYMGYRPSYQVIRTLHHIRNDPAAIALLTGYLGCVVHRSEQADDPAVRRYLRERQRLRRLFDRRDEALGRSAPTPLSEPRP
jgi:glycosyltransferase involved in cell wall biosynthesis